jgi:hypothetical protein
MVNDSRHHEGVGSGTSQMAEKYPGSDIERQSQRREDKAKDRTGKVERHTGMKTTVMVRPC